MENKLNKALDELFDAASEARKKGIEISISFEGKNGTEEIQLLPPTKP